MSPPPIKKPCCLKSQVPQTEEPVVPEGSLRGPSISRASWHLKWRGAAAQAGGCQRSGTWGEVSPHPTCTLPSSHYGAPKSCTWPCRQPCEGPKGRGSPVHSLPTFLPAEGGWPPPSGPWPLAPCPRGDLFTELPVGSPGWKRTRGWVR